MFHSKGFEFSVALPNQRESVMSERFYLPDPPDFSPGLRLRLDEAEGKHATRVLRKGVGDSLLLFDGRGYEYQARIEEAGKKGVEVSLQQRKQVDKELPCRVHLLAAVPKGKLADHMIQQLCELGVSSVTPLRTERSVVKPGANTLESWRQTVIEASKQNGRTLLMEIRPVTEFNAALAACAGKRAVLLHPGAEHKLTEALLPTRPAAGGECWICIGPEGGFSDAELETARAAGFIMARFGRSVMRIGTAAVAAAALLRGLCQLKVS